MRAVGAPGQTVGDDQVLDHRMADPSGSSRYSVAIGRDNDSSSIVPAKNRPSGETLPSLNRVPGTRSGPVRKVSAAGVEVEQMEAVLQRHDGARLTRGDRTTRSVRASASRGWPRSPDRAGALRAHGCRPSTAPAPPATRPGIPPAPPARPARTSRRSPWYPSGQAVNSVATLSSIRRWMSSASSSQPNTQTVAMPSKFMSRRVEKNSSQSTSPLPISLCWWTRASTPGGLMM